MKLQNTTANKTVATISVIKITHDCDLLNNNVLIYTTVA